MRGPLSRRHARVMAEKLTIVDVEGSVAAAVARIEDALDRLGVAVFARIDHAAGARAAGLELADEVVLVFGDPAVGTVLMQAIPASASTCPCACWCGRRTGGRAWATATRGGSPSIPR